MRSFVATNYIITTVLPPGAMSSLIQRCAVRSPGWGRLLLVSLLPCEFLLSCHGRWMLLDKVFHPFPCSAEPARF